MSEFENKSASSVDLDIGTAADVEAIMKKYDKESNTRLWEGKPKMIIRYLMAAFSI